MGTKTTLGDGELLANAILRAGDEDDSVTEIHRAAEKKVSRQEASERKSEIRISKEAPRTETNPPIKSQSPNPKRAGLEY
jgi:hypothetical protein